MSSFLSGRTIMVTGATSGIGYETARLLAECGTTVLLPTRADAS
ncbi:SDR family NAD(P)-dependent oxidoreductase [Streptomyces goshikiensis]